MGSIEVSTGGFLKRISRVVRRELSEVLKIFIVIVCSHIGTIEVFGLQGSVVVSRRKSDVISQLRREETLQSSKGVTWRLILQSVCSGSQVNSERDISSFCKRYVVCCHENVLVTRSGSMVVSFGGFLRTIFRVARTEESDF